MSSYSQLDNSDPIYAEVDTEIPCPSLLDVLDFLKFPDLTELNKIQWDEGEELDNIIKYLNENSMASDSEFSDSSSIPETSDLSETIQNKSVQDTEDTESIPMQSDYPETQVQTQQADSSEMPLDTYNGEIDEPFKKSNYMYNSRVPSNNKSKSTSERYSEDESEDSSDGYSEDGSEYYSDDDEYEA